MKYEVEVSEQADRDLREIFEYIAFELQSQENAIGQLDRLEEQILSLARYLEVDHFAEGESPDPPFICYLLPGSDNFAADGRVYFRISEVRIELYTDRKDPGAEALVETVLDDAGIFYNKSEVWIQSEKLYEVLYSMEL